MLTSTEARNADIQSLLLLAGMPPSELQENVLNMGQRDSRLCTGACRRGERRQGGAGGGHSLQSCEKSLVGGKWKVGEEGLVTMAGAELMPLDTTEDAGT